jgi:hypothetical protein
MNRDQRDALHEGGGRARLSDGITQPSDAADDHVDGDR